MIATLDKQSDASWPVSRSTAHHPNQWANTSEHVVQNLSLRTWRFWRRQHEENNTYLPLRPSSLQRRSQRLTRRMNTGAGRSPSGYIDQVVVSFTDHKTFRNSLALCLFWKLVYTNHTISYNFRLENDIDYRKYSPQNNPLFLLSFPKYKNVGLKQRSFL